MNRQFFTATGVAIMAVGCVGTLIDNAPVWLGWTGILLVGIGFVMTFIANIPAPGEQQTTSD